MIRHDCVIFDIDGVIANISHAIHLIQRDQSDWDAYNAAMPACKPIPANIALMNLLRPNYSIVLLTARNSANLADATALWLSRHKVPYDGLMMRHPAVPYATAKQDMLTELKRHYNPVLAFDDDPRNVAMYEANGVPAVYIHSGLYGDQWERYGKSSEARDVQEV